MPSNDLQPGLEHHLERAVTADLSPAHLQPLVVLSTPAMIGLMEDACLQAVQPHLGPDRTTVGTRVDVQHLAAARGDEVVQVWGRLRQVRGRWLVFDVNAQVGERVIGRGTHERAVVERERFGD